MYKSKLLSKNRISHCFFNKNGGVSKGYFSSLNVSFKVGDDPNNVIKNREIIAKKFNLEYKNVLILNQVHSNKVYLIKKKLDNKDVEEIKADAMITQVPNLLLTITTADCVPILLSDINNNTIAALHSGWQGALGGIIENTINKMKEIAINPCNIIAAIGPCIHEESYEVDKNFYNLFLDKNIKFKKFFKKSEEKDKYFFNLVNFSYNILYEGGIKKSQIEVMNVNTYEEKNSFFSHRRSTHQKEKRGLQASCITILKEE